MWPSDRGGGAPYLFAGARGVSKTSTARTWPRHSTAAGHEQQAVQCLRGYRAIAVGEDATCSRSTRQQSRIDEVREIRQTSVQADAAGTSSTLSTKCTCDRAAFNALLKTLEEPPPHVKFIFATTEVQKIPATILSRCQRFDFLGISSSEIVRRLRELVRGEKQEVEEAALEQIARRAGGSMRDAQSLLDQLMAFGSGNLTSEHVSQLLGTAHDDRVAEIAAAILAQDTKAAIGLVGRALDEGAQTGELMDQLILYWRDLMIVTYTGTDDPTTTPPRLRPTLAEQAEAADRLGSGGARHSGHDKMAFAQRQTRQNSD